LQQYVKIVPSLAAAVSMINSRPQERRPDGILIDPKVSVEQAHFILERIEVALTRSSVIEDPALRVHGDVANLQTKLTLPTYMQ